MEEMDAVVGIEQRLDALRTCEKNQTTFVVRRASTVPCVIQ